MATAQNDTPLRRDWDAMDLPVHWSRLAPPAEGQPKPDSADAPLDLSLHPSVPDGQYPVATGAARSRDHLARIKDGMLDLASTAMACYEAIWRDHGLEPVLPWQSTGEDPCHIFVEHIEFDAHENVVRIWCGS